MRWAAEVAKWIKIGPGENDDFPCADTGSHLLCVVNGGLEDLWCQPVSYSDASLLNPEIN